MLCLCQVVIEVEDADCLEWFLCASESECEYGRQDESRRKRQVRLALVPMLMLLYYWWLGTLQSLKRQCFGVVVRSNRTQPRADEAPKVATRTIAEPSCSPYKPPFFCPVSAKPPL